MTPVKKGHEARRNRVADLLRAEVPIPKIIDITGASQASIYRLKKRLEAGGTTKVTRSDRPTLKLTKNAIADLKSKF